MTQWIWISAQLLHRIHDRQILEIGGLGGVRDDNALESALSRPLQLANYGSPTVYELAAAYLWALTKNHGYVDGNKRTAWVTAKTFLKLNGFELREKQVPVVSLMNAIASGEVTEERLALWLKERVSR
jgi:death-on-curing protein